MMNQAALILAILSAIFAFFSVRDYLRGGHKLSPAAKVWLRIALIYAAVTLLLLLLV